MSDDLNESAQHTPNGRILAKNTFINLLGQGIPLIFAAIAIPFVIDGLGTVRFGILTIVWIIIGYFGLFDMGIGRATTKFIADLQAEGEGRLAPFIFTSILLLVIIGIVGGVVIYFCSPWVVHRILNVPGKLRSETVDAFQLLSISIPFVLGAVGARGSLEALQRFDIVNIVKIPASILNYVCPLLVLPFTNKLQPIVLILVLARMLNFLCYVWFCLGGMRLQEMRTINIRSWIKRLMSFGAWIMVSNFVSPLMEYMDRFIIGAILTMSAVAYYTTPYEVVSRLLIVAGSFMGVMFPAFSVYSLSNRDKLAASHKRSIRYLVAVMFPVTIFLLIASRPLLLFWLGADFALKSTLVLQILTIGVLVNSVARVPSTVIQAMGRPSVTAKLHLVEFPIYVGLIWYLTYRAGIAGVALAWTVRVALDGILLLYFSHKLFGLKLSFQSTIIYGIIGVIVGGVFIGAQFEFLDRPLYEIAAAILASLLAGCFSWWIVLDFSDHQKVRSFIGTAFHRFSY